MPTVSVGRDRLFAALGRVYTQEEFEKLCFDFGIELDDVTTEKAIIRKEKHLDEDGEADGDEEVIYKIEVAANRYDLLCLEGIARSLRIFIGTEATPVFKLSSVPNGSMLQMHVKKETSQIRPYIVCAVLRGVTFDEIRYNSFIDLQDKLHQNICRKRTLVAIGTHDLDTLQGPFSYEALPPQEINFVPLKQERHFTADKLMDFYKSDMKLKKFLHIIENSPEFPVIYDSNRTVLSLPPIINGAHSAITLKTRNVFIECTATDLTKANIVLNTMVAMFSEYCENKFEVEPVEVISYDGSKAIYPDLSCYKMEASISEILGRIGISLDETQVISLLNKMQLQAEPCPSKGEPRISVSVPPTRSDVLHACDLAEDVAIAYGYNNVPKSKPKSMTIGGRQPLNRFSDKIRAEVTRAGYMEVLTFVLTSYEENFDMINRKDDGNKAVIIANPRTSEFEVVRTSLMSCLLKTLKHNIDHPRPIKIFEVGDVVVLDTSRDVGASNNRRLAALYCSSNSGFEEIMGLVDRIVKIVRAPHITFSHPYYVETNEPEFFTKRQCKIVTSDGKQVGYLGIVHAEVLRKFGIPDPCTFVEMDLEALL
ncbi:phenylalanine--tRNA ligase beta subunit, cytoplasmic [Lolium perenne]|uniref:phenylalanine--tRNA ligase beta subunit, cytoplasmic n=1 Tax=Lolium perenne TaxID=4522 RepID=UPI0021EA2191|nr:phenylalanine--tRNA ligase beta subunit, cytoplasmic [Lolium perenne]